MLSFSSSLSLAYCSFFHSCKRGLKRAQSARLQFTHHRQLLCLCLCLCAFRMLPLKVIHAAGECNILSSRLDYRHCALKVSASPRPFTRIIHSFKNPHGSLWPLLIRCYVHIRLGLGHPWSCIQKSLLYLNEPQAPERCSRKAFLTSGVWIQTIPQLFSVVFSVWTKQLQQKGYNFFTRAFIAIKQTQLITPVNLGLKWEPASTSALCG